MLTAHVEAFQASIANGLVNASFACGREMADLLIDRILVDALEVKIRYITPGGGSKGRLAIGLSGGTVSASAGQPDTTQR